MLLQKFPVYEYFYGKLAKKVSFFFGKSKNLTRFTLVERLFHAKNKKFS